MSDKEHRALLDAIRRIRQSDNHERVESDDKNFMDAEWQRLADFYGAENGPYETAEIFAAKFVRVHSEADIDRQIKICKVSLFFTIGLALFVLLSSTSLLIRVAVCVIGSGVLYGLLTLF